MTANTTQSTRLRKFPMPDVGEGLTEAEILEWKVAVGDTLVVNQVMVEIETAKAAVELPSPYAGRVHELLVQPGVTVDVGTPIIVIDTDPAAGPVGGPQPSQSTAPADETGSGAAGSEGGAKIGEATADGRVATLVGYIPATGASVRRPRRGAGTANGAEKLSTATVPAPIPEPIPEPQATAPAGTRAPLATPPVRKLARDLGIDLSGVSATRADGVISRADVEAFAATNGSGPEGGTPGPATTVPSGPAFDPTSRERRVPVKGVRRMTAAAMVASAFTAPHVTEFLTVDVTAMMELRERLRKRPEFAAVKVTPLAFAARAVCLSVRRTPEVNAVWDEAAQEIVYKEYVNLGFAAATPRGLIVPNVKDAGALDLLGIATALSAVTETARAGRTAPADMAGGTFTITNVGVFGVDTGTPIINPGESAILALGSIKDAPWVVDGQLAVRKVCQLALSFDHRVVDGQQGSEFLADVGALLADPGLALAY